MNQKAKIAAVILAAGKGSRMGSSLHKVLHKIAGKPMLGHVLDNLDALQVDTSIVVVGAGREQIHAAFPEILTVIQEDQLGTGHAVGTAKQALLEFKGTLLVLYGDVPLVRADTMTALCDNVTGQTPLAVLGFRPADTLKYGRLVTNSGGQLERIVEHAEATTAEREINFCNSGILAGRADVLFGLLAEVENNNTKGEYYLTDIVGLARAAGHKVATSEANPMEVTGVNSQEELARLNDQISSKRVR